MVSGAALYFLLLSHYLPGSFFPKVDDASLALPVNFARLIVWSFVAGLATRLVPQAINSLKASFKPRK